MGQLRSLCTPSAGPQLSTVLGLLLFGGLPAWTKVTLRDPVAGALVRAVSTTAGFLPTGPAVKSEGSVSDSRHDEPPEECEEEACEEDPPQEIDEAPG